MSEQEQEKDVYPYKFLIVLRGCYMVHIHTALIHAGFKVESGDGVMVVSKEKG